MLLPCSALTWLRRACRILLADGRSAAIRFLRRTGLGMEAGLEPIGELGADDQGRDLAAAVDVTGQCDIEAVLADVAARDDRAVRLLGQAANDTVVAEK